MKKHLSKNRLMKVAFALVIIFAILMTDVVDLTAMQNTPAVYAESLHAERLPEGFTYDQAHDDGILDWTGEDNEYVIIHHVSEEMFLAEDEGGTECNLPNNCHENVTKIAETGSVGGIFERDVIRFEIELAVEHNWQVGRPFVSVCSDLVYVGDLYDPTPYDSYRTETFKKFEIDVPAGCRNWTISALAGDIHFRGLNVEYVAPTPTPTFTASPTYTPTSTAVPTFTATTTALPTETLMPTATATLVPTATPVNTGETPASTQPVIIIIQEQTVIAEQGGNSSSGGLEQWAVTPTPSLGWYYGGNGESVSCRWALRIFAYVDSNNDKLMSIQEGAQDLEIVFLNADYSPLASRYTKEGQAVFCLTPAQLGKLVRVDIPYLHQSQTVTIPKDVGDEDVEIWFRLEPPTLPLYLP